MSKSKIPQPTKRLNVSSIPVPIKSNRCVTNQAIKPKLPTVLKGVCSTKPVAVSEQPKTWHRKTLNRLLSENNKSNVLYKKGLLRQEQNPILKGKMTSQQPAIKVLKTVPVNTIKSTTRTVSNLKDKSEKEKEFRRISRVPGTFKKQENNHNLKFVAKPVPANAIKRAPGVINFNLKDRLPKDKPAKDRESRIISRARGVSQKSNAKELKPVKKPAILKISKRNDVKENIEDSAPSTGVKGAESGFDDNDAEFKASGFYKSLILNDRELSPGIIKLCSDEKFSSIAANIKSPATFLSRQTAEDIVDELRRFSNRIIRKNGKLTFLSPKVNPCINSAVKKSYCDILTMKENCRNRGLVAEGRMSELRGQRQEKSGLGNADPVLRRWTCTAPSQSAMKTMKLDIAAELRRLSEVRRNSGFLVSAKINSLNPMQEALKTLEVLRSKKKEKIKKKVTFHLPNSSSSDLPLYKESKNCDKKILLESITEGSRQTTPEMEANLYKSNGSKMLSEDCKESNEDTTQVPTPELHLNPIRINPDLFPGRKLGDKNRGGGSLTPELDVETPYSRSKTSPQTSKICSKSEIAHGTLTSCLKNKNNGVPNREVNKLVSIKLSPCKSVLYTPIPENILDKEAGISFCGKSSELKYKCVINAMEKMAITSTSQFVNETKEFAVDSKQKIFTPMPVSLYSKSYQTNCISPNFFTTNKGTDLCSFAPICTPFVLRNMGNKTESNLSSVRQKLEFKEEPQPSNERRESQIYIQNIPTVQKMYDVLCDQECSILSSQTSTTTLLNRNLGNPIANILNNGDEMHFLPIRLS